MNIRILTAMDGAVYRNLRIQALRTNPEAFATAYEDYLLRSTEQVAAQLEPDANHFTLGAFVADRSDKLAGTATLVRERSPKMHHIANVFAMYVAPDVRRQGVGRCLLTEVIGRARQLDGLDQLRLSVIQVNDAAVSLYQSVGFQTYGIERNALKTAEQSWDEVHMVLPLRGEGQSSFDEPRGFSHVTINVSNLDESLRFYIGNLGMKLVHQGRVDAYLEWGTAWFCLQERSELTPHQSQLGVDHVALYVAPTEFHSMIKVLQSANTPMLRGPVERGGGWTANFVDPDGTQLEFHTGTLADRMKVWK